MHHALSNFFPSPSTVAASSVSLFPVVCTVVGKKRRLISCPFVQMNLSLSFFNSFLSFTFYLAVFVIAARPERKKSFSRLEIFDRF